MSINKGKFDHSKLANPRIVGPGGWKTLHILAKFSDIYNKDNYSEFIRFFCSEFRCGECSEHCSVFMNKNPPEKFKGQKWGMSEHSRQFHNAANKGLGKPIMDWDEYESLWISNDKTAICQKGCGENNEKYYPEELSEINFDRLKKLNHRDPELVQVRRVNSPRSGKRSAIRVKGKK